MKVSAPFACLLLPLIALFFAATGRPSATRPDVDRERHPRRRPRDRDLLRRLDGPWRDAPTLARGLGPSIVFSVVALAMGIRQRIRSQTSG